MERERNSSFHFPPGFRFHPSDEELIVHYLQNKVTARPLPASIIAEIDLYKYNPWELPQKALFGEDEWYFFSPRDRKYPNGARPNRAAGSGFWKATGTDKPILTSSGTRNVGVKKALVFYTGRPPKGVKTDWIMNEYRLLDTMIIKPSRLEGSMRLDDWVLCRVRQKGNMLKNLYDELPHSPSKEVVRYLPKLEEACPTYGNCDADMIMDFLNKDCRLLASILAGQALPPINTISNGSFQGSNNDNSYSSVYDGNNNMNSPITVSSFNDNNPMKRKPDEEERFDDLLTPNKKLNDSNRNEDYLPSRTVSNGNVNYYCQNQAQDSFYIPNSLDPITGFLELNELAFASKYLQY